MRREPIVFFPGDAPIFVERLGGELRDRLSDKARIRDARKGDKKGRELPAHIKTPSKRFTPTRRQRG